MSSNGDPKPAKIKRTSFSPWSSGVMGSKTSSSKKDPHGPEPALVVSDIVQRATMRSPATAGLASSARIQALQRDWEAKNDESGRKRESPSSDAPGAKRQNTAEKRPSPAGSPAAAAAADGGRQTTNSQIRAGARRYTEAEVVKQMAEVMGASSIKKSAMTPPVLTAAAPPPQSSQPMHFPTGNELLKKIMSSQAAGSPSPAPKADALTPAASSPAPGDQITAIVHAEPNRPYSFYPSPEHGMISGRGALIPTNYTLHNDPKHPEHPFICPVRECRRLFRDLKGLGGHFGAGHCTTTFNDNGDGTLSKVGTYVKNGPGGTPGIVVSKGPLPPDAPPPAEPGLPFFAAQKRQSTAGVVERRPSARLSGAANKGTASSPAAQPILTFDVEKYLNQFLSPSQRTHHREDIAVMLSLPRRRFLPASWIQCHRGSDVDAQHYACALAFLTGTEVTGDAKCMANSSRPSARLSDPCIALPPAMSASAKIAFSKEETCVGCKYWSHLQRQANKCDWAPEPKTGRGGSTGSARSTSSSSEAGWRTDAMDVEEEPQPEPEPEPEPQLEPEPVIAIAIPVSEPVQELRRTRRQISAPGSSTGQVTMQEQSVVGIVGRPGQMGGAELLEMEEWEVAPGRLMDESSSDNVAFSNSYLTSGHPVTISDDVSFNVLVVKPGSVSHWAVEDDKLRTCSVAAGKVRVTMGDKTFQLGPNGMFVVRPGQTCKVENRLYLDSVVHCTTIGDFALQQ
ncbi:hypothetical protein ACJ41O_010616 [Fusarium nematophilum]